jgi:hypothetical protein
MEINGVSEMGRTPWTRFCWLIALGTQISLCNVLACSPESGIVKRVIPLLGEPFPNERCLVDFLDR